MYVSVCVENVLCMYNIVITMDITGIGSYWPLPKLSTNHSHIRSTSLTTNLLLGSPAWALALSRWSLGHGPWQTALPLPSPAHTIWLISGRWSSSICPQFPFWPETWTSFDLYNGARLQNLQSIVYCVHEILSINTDKPLFPGLQAQLLDVLPSPLWSSASSDHAHLQVHNLL